MATRELTSHEREKVIAAARARGGRRRYAAAAAPPAPEGDAPVKDDKPPTWKDPGNYISPERTDAAIDRIFGDGPRLTASTGA